jgi:hypothetical protein
VSEAEIKELVIKEHEKSLCDDLYDALIPAGRPIEPLRAALQVAIKNDFSDQEIARVNKVKENHLA